MRVACILSVAIALLGPSLARAAPTDEEMALAHFEKGTQLFEERQYAHAIAEFDAARRLRPDPALDFNIALCHDVLGDRAEAVSAYRRYLTSTPPPADAPLIRNRLRQLDEKRPPSPAEILMRRPAPPPRATEPAAKPVPAPVLAPSSVTLAPEETPLAKRWWVWVMAAEGAVALAAVGVTLGILLTPVDAQVPSTTLGPTTLGFH